MRFALHLGTFVCLLGGCSGYIDDVERFDPYSDQLSAASLCDPSFRVHEQLIRPKCANAGCHDAETKTQGLDLSSPDFARHLIGVESRCEKRIFVNSSTATAGFFFDKLMKSAPPCGGVQMPVGAKLSQDELNCLRQHFREAAGLEQAPASTGAQQ